MTEPKKLKILSLDGGGIRGLSSLEILRRIMYRVGQAMQPPIPDLRPCDYFDLIGGTSTGGIIALMLGRLRMSVDECVREYAALGQYIFGVRQGPPKEELFVAARLIDAIKKVIKAKLGNKHEDAPLFDPLGDDCCKTLVYTLSYENANSVQPQALRTYHSTYEQAIPCTIWQAARATSAAPTFFEPAVIGFPPEKWIDAGMKFNNPSRALRSEAGKIWGNIYGVLDYNTHIALFLSLGTGFAEIARFDDALTLKEKISKTFQVPLRAVEVMKSIVSDTETTAADLEHEFNDSIFHRFNVEQGLQAVELFEYEKLPRILADTTNYLNRRTKEVTTCVIQMASLSLALGPLAQKSDEDENSTAVGEAEDEALRQRLENLKMCVLSMLGHSSLHVYQKTSKRIEHSDSYKSLKRIAYVPWLWEPLVQADILDKRGSLALLEKSDPDSLSDRSLLALTDFVLVQNDAFQTVQQSFALYRRLYHGTELFFEKSSLEYCWVANRMGSILETFGLRDDALTLYKDAAAGRIYHLGAADKASVESAERAALLESILRLH